MFLTPDQFYVFIFFVLRQNILPSTLGQLVCSDSARDWQSFFSIFV